MGNRCFRSGAGGAGRVGVRPVCRAKRKVRVTLSLPSASILPRLASCWSGHRLSCLPWPSLLSPAASSSSGPLSFPPSGLPSLLGRFRPPGAVLSPGGGQPLTFNCSSRAARRFSRSRSIFAHRSGNRRSSRQAAACQSNLVDVSVVSSVVPSLWVTTFVLTTS